VTAMTEGMVRIEAQVNCDKSSIIVSKILNEVTTGISVTYEQQIIVMRNKNPSIPTPLHKVTKNKQKTQHNKTKQTSKTVLTKKTKKKIQYPQERYL
jgi:hypothetical protein